ncbi:RidA family protein [Ferrovibrio sp. MS7]|uniref:RidA family protein n=1 Tax=Ferrovibrio plantarum TaxID=3119164 RepID=UPI0031364C2D
MPSTAEQRLTELGLSLPVIPEPTANYVPFRVDEGLVFLAGQTNDVQHKPHKTGKVPTDHSPEVGQEAARICALNLLAALKLACGGDLDRVKSCLSVRGFVNAAPDFDRVPFVINGASDLFVAVFGEAGRHARTAVGVATLPRQALVEVDAVFRIRMP